MSIVSNKPVKTWWQPIRNQMIRKLDEHRKTWEQDFYLVIVRKHTKVKMAFVLHLGSTIVVKVTNLKWSETMGGCHFSEWCIPQKSYRYILYCCKSKLLGSKISFYLFQSQRNMYSQHLWKIYISSLRFFLFTSRLLFLLFYDEHSMLILSWYDDSTSSLSGWVQRWWVYHILCFRKYRKSHIENQEVLA